MIRFYFYSSSETAETFDKLYKDKASFLFCLLFPINISLSVNTVKGMEGKIIEREEKYIEEFCLLGHNDF
jgi:hypothetical protein